MAPQKVYTIGVSNKFAAFGDESSSDEEGVPKASKKEKYRSGGEGKISSSSSGARGTGSSAHPTASKENRMPEGSGGNYQDANRYDGDRFRGLRHDGPRASGMRENGDRIMGFRGRGGGDRGGFRGREGYRGGGGFRRGAVNTQRTGFRDVEDGNGGGFEATNHDQRQRGERFGDSNFRGGRGGGRGGRGGSGGGDRASGFSRYRRDFDRHSGTGRGSEMKKDGGGGHNWGNEEEDWGFSEAVEQPQISISFDELVIDENPKGDTVEAWGSLEDGVAAAEEEVFSPKVEEPEMLDLDAYRAEQRAKRLNLPEVSTNMKTGTKITTVKELEAQGYSKHVKRSEDEEDSEEEESSEEESDREDDRADRKKKTMNVYEYIHNEGGRVRLFPERRGGRGGGLTGGERRSPRGGASAGLRAGGSREGPTAFGSRRGRLLKGKDAPDIQDERAFPKLG